VLRGGDRHMDGGINDILGATLNSVISSVGVFVPRFISGLIVLLIGIVVASFLKQLLLQLFRIIKLDQFLDKYSLAAPKTKEKVNWAQILAELARWFIIILFLIPTVDAWGLGRFVEVLNELLNFLPRVFISVLLLIVGIVISKLVYDLLLASVGGVSKEAWSVLVFVFLVVLNQLGIASDLIRILFAGIVGMTALAGGLAFGLGGKDIAKELLTKLLKRI